MFKIPNCWNGPSLSLHDDCEEEDVLVLLMMMRRRITMSTARTLVLTDNSGTLMLNATETLL